MTNLPVTVGTIFDPLNYPSLWPVLIFPVLLAAGWIAARRPGRGWPPPAVPPSLLPAGGALCVALYVWSVGNYLASAQFVDFYEPREASVAWVLARGGAVYPGAATQERYSGPYGPMLYLALGLFQRLLGPSVFSTKLPCALAGLLSVAGFWAAARRLGASRRRATLLAGMEAALLLALRYVSFWAKTDPFILLLVTAGLHCALGRRAYWPVAFGVCAGLAADLKPHALAYFLPVAVIAWQRGWRLGASLCAGAAAVFSALLLFAVASRQFSLVNYLDFLRVTAREGVGSAEAFGFCRWLGLLAAMVFIGDRFLPRQIFAPKGLYRAALAAGAALVAVPACAVGAGQIHLLALIPTVLLAPGDGFAGMGADAARPPHFFWRAAAGAGLAACLLVATQTAWRTYRFRSADTVLADACRAEVRRFTTEHPQWTILVASGDGDDDLSTDCRYEVVFAGHPIGLDAAAMMDYQRGGAPEPDLSALVREVQARTGRPVVWIAPRGDAPFTERNIYDARQPAHSEGFRREFFSLYERQREVSRFFDVYVARTAEPAAAVCVRRGVIP